MPSRAPNGEPQFHTPVSIAISLDGGFAVAEDARQISWSWDRTFMLPALRCAGAGGIFMERRLRTVDHPASDAPSTDYDDAAPSE